MLRIAVALCLCFCACVCLPSRGEWAAAEIVVDGVSAHDPATTLYKTAKKLYAKDALMRSATLRSREYGKMRTYVENAKVQSLG